MAPGFGVLLRDCGTNRLAVLARLRQKLGLSLAVVKAVAGAGPVELVSGECLGVARRLADEFQQLGAAVEVFISGTGHEHEHPQQRIKLPPVRAADFAVGLAVSGIAKHRVEFGLFIDFQYDPPYGIDGLLHFGRTPCSDLARGFTCDQSIQTVVTRWDFNQERLEVALPADPSWRTPAVLEVAQGIRLERALSRLPILGDALEDAGCTDALVLAHCRSAVPLTESWLLPLLLGRE